MKVSDSLRVTLGRIQVARNPNDTQSGGSWLSGYLHALEVGIGVAAVIAFIGGIAASINGSS